MAPDAGPDEVRRAYLALAREHHPDTAAGLTPDERAAADVRMREINAAWQVLRNPRARAAYDARLRSGRPVGSGSGATTPAPQRRPASTARPATAPGSSSVPPPPRSLLRFGPIALVVVVLLAVVVFTAYANKQTNVDPAPSSPTSGPRYEVGRCVRVTASESGLLPIEVACGITAAYRIAATTDLGRPCPPDTTPLAVPADKVTLCLAT